MIGDNHEFLAIPHRYCALRKDRTANLIDWTSRTLWIEAKRTQHVPGRGFTAVVIPRKPLRIVPVPDIHDLTDMSLRLPRLAGKVIQVGDVKARLISLRILSY